MMTSLLSIYLSALSPLSYGLKDAKTDMERYEVLYRTHLEAIRQNRKVTYAGIDTIRIQIPPKAKSIPLPEETDFADVVIVVKNESRQCYLFKRTENVDSISVDASDIDKGNFCSYPQLKRGKHLLFITDATPWVKERIGHKNGSIRKDILYIEDGKARNHTIMPYNTPISKPVCTYRSLLTSLSLRNLVVIRDTRSTNVTKCFCFENMDGILVENIIIKTTDNPHSLYGDGVFIFNNCTNLRMENIRIEGTYSLKDKYGYGINMDNVWNCSFSNLYGHGNWGIFGNNNVNEANLYDCDINRMDVHCYGRDISCYRCIFKNYYNQYSSVYGTIKYDRCYFENFLPYLNGGSYNAYVPVKIIMNNCKWFVTKKYNYIVDMWYPYDKQNIDERQIMRPELAVRYKPIVKIKKLHVIYQEGTTSYKLYRR